VKKKKLLFDTYPFRGDMCRIPPTVWGQPVTRRVYAIWTGKVIGHYRLLERVDDLPRWVFARMVGNVVAARLPPTRARENTCKRKS